MPDIFLRDIPEELYECLSRRAQEAHRTLADEVIYLLTEFITPDIPRQRHQQAMASILERMRQKHPTGADSLEMLREDRER